MYDVQVKIKSQWHDITDFASYDDITDMGKVQDVKGLPDGLDLKADFDGIIEWLSLPDDEQDIVLAYYRVTDTFNPEEAQEAYAGTFADGAEFAESLCEDVYYDALDAVPDFLRKHIDWQAVWDAELHYDYFEQDGHYFRNM